MEASGGSNNAYTRSDVTVYQNWFPASALPVIFELEADRMRNLQFDPKVVESERGVVQSERRTRVDDDNFGTLLEQLQATAYVAHPYQIPTIGWPSDIENWKIEDLQAFYGQYYAPNNAVMFVVGAVEPDAVFALADRYLAPLQAQPAPPPVTTNEPPQLGERRFKVVRDAQTPLLAMAWHASAAPERESRVMEVLLAILGAGDSSRLHQRLVEREQAAVQVGSQLDAGIDPGLALAFAIVPPGGDVTKTERLIDEEIERLAKDGPTAAELAKARNQRLAEFWRGLETISGKAQALGTYEVFHGDYRKLFDAASVYESITADDVRNAAATVLRAENRTVGILEPRPAAEAGSKGGAQ
jgi:zinc protease